jgi:hypothetical protein
VYRHLEARSSARHGRLQRVRSGVLEGEHGQLMRPGFQAIMCL